VPAPLPGPVRHVLAIAPNWIGDVAMATPALRALAHRFPEATLSVAARKGGCDLLAGLPWITHCCTMPPKAGIWEMRAAARALPERPDITVVFPHSFRAALFACHTGASARVGYDRGGRGWLLTHRVPPHREGGKVVPIYMAEEYLALARAIGAQDDGAGLELVAPGPEIDAVRAALPAGVPIVAIAPGAAFGPSKCWPAERFAVVADALAAKRGATCVLLTGPGEEATRDAVLKAAKTPLLDVQGDAPSLARLKAAISCADLLIGNDSGPRHIAIAFRKPVICIMGPTSPRYTAGPYEKGEVLRVDVPCGPCQKPVCATDHRCMTTITPEDVLQSATKWI
jgi:heptosyltransferase-2